MTDLLNQLQQKQTNFMNWLELHVEDENVLNSAIDFFSFNERAIEAAIELARIDYAATQRIEIENKSLEKVIQTYTIDRALNKEQATECFINGLILVLRDEYTFDGIMYKKGNISKLKSQILK